MWLFSFAKNGSWKRTGKVGTPFPGSASKFARKLPIRSALQRPFERYFNGVPPVLHYCNLHCHRSHCKRTFRPVFSVTAKLASDARFSLSHRQNPLFAWALSGDFRKLQGSSGYCNTWCPLTRGVICRRKQQQRRVGARFGGLCMERRCLPSPGRVRAPLAWIIPHDMRGAQMGSMTGL